MWLKQQKKQKPADTLPLFGYACASTQVLFNLFVAGSLAAIFAFSTQKPVRRNQHDDDEVDNANVIHCCERRNGQFRILSSYDIDGKNDKTYFLQ